MSRTRKRLILHTLPMISVIIPAYNAEKYISQAILSVQKQDWDGKIEIIVVDDGSSDHGADIAESLGCSVLAKSNGGAASARNLGMKHASGELWLFLDADDFLVPDAIKTLYNPFSVDSSVEIVFGQTKDFISPELSNEEAVVLKPQKEPYLGLIAGCALIKRDVFSKIGEFDESLQTGETVDWVMRVRSSSVNCFYVEKITTQRRLHLSNTGRKLRLNEYSNYAALIRKRMKKK